MERYSLAPPAYGFAEVWDTFLPHHMYPDVQDSYWEAVEREHEHEEVGEIIPIGSQTYTYAGTTHMILSRFLTRVPFHVATSGWSRGVLIHEDGAEPFAALRKLRRDN